MQMLKNRKIKGMMVLEEDPEILLCARMSARACVGDSGRLSRGFGPLRLVTAW